jgi:hypothetical protein
MTPARVEVRHGSHFITFSQLIQVTWTDVAFNSSCRDLPVANVGTNIASSS